MTTEPLPTGPAPCLRWAVSTVVGVPVDETPDFKGADSGYAQMVELERWANERGLRTLHVDLPEGWHGWDCVPFSTATGAIGLSVGHAVALSPTGRIIADTIARDSESPTRREDIEVAVVFIPADQ